MASDAIADILLVQRVAQRLQARRAEAQKQQLQPRRVQVQKPRQSPSRERQPRIDVTNRKLVLAIAAILDYPTVYERGPCRYNRAKAQAIVAYLRREDLLTERAGNLTV